MGALPKRKHSTRRKGKRRAAISLSLANLIPCPNCQELTFPHQVCPKCGYYKEKEVVKIKGKEEKKKTEKK